MVTDNKITPLIVIVGETASGKSDLAMRLAEQFNGEIVVADSWTVYRGFDIGTAKPSKADQEKIKHHLIDVADPKNGFNAAQFKRLATSAIENITNRGKTPILAGGTGLYIDSVIFDYSFLAPGPTDDRKVYNGMPLEDISKIVESKNIDTSGVDVRNKRRLIRLIENNGQRPSKSALREGTIMIGLSLDREKLTDNVTKRVDEMMRIGLSEEVKRLSSMYGWEIEPMKGIGYREFESYAKDGQDLEDVKQVIIKNTLDLAKKQRTWFKRNNSIHWVNNSSRAVDIVTMFLSKF